MSQKSSLAAECPLLPTAGSGVRDRSRIDLTTGRGQNDSRVELVLKAATLFSALVVLLVAFFVLQKGIPGMIAGGWDFVLSGGWDVDLERAWSDPTFVAFSARPLIAGTALTTLMALTLAVLLGLGCAIFLTEVAPGWLREPAGALVQLLAGIPSVVFGLVGFAVVVPFITSHILPAHSMDVAPEIPFDGQSLLAAVIVLTFMIMPFFVAVATDALRAVPRPLRDGARALGMGKWRTIVRVQLPVALPGIIAGAVLGAARAIGEAIALSMVAGALALTPGIAHGPVFYLLTPVRTMASAIVETGGEAMSIPAIQGALFGLAAMLLFFSFALSLVARLAYSWSARKLNLLSDRTV